MMNLLKAYLRPIAAVCLTTLAACSGEDRNATEPGVEQAREFIAGAEAELSARSEYESRIYWVRANFITDDTNWLVEQTATESSEIAARLANETKKFNGLDLPPDTARKMQRLKQAQTIPAPQTEGAAAELAGITTQLASIYSTGTGTYKGEARSLVELEDLFRSERDPDLLLEMWRSWREVSPPMKDDYARMVEIANAGAAELGYADLADMWLSGYDMPPGEMAAEVDRLWRQVKPLYDALHCHVRAELADEYGDDLVPRDGLIPAHLLGNMWAQTWNNIYDLVGPEDADPGYDLTAALRANDYDAQKVARTAEQFFVSLGFDPLPETFWRRSLFVQPGDRQVICHASAWNIDNEDDVRIKMCTRINADDFVTMHHEIGHNIYQRAYKDQDFLYKTGANDGFHEAIGDMIALSVTPEYLKQIGLIEDVPDESADIGLLMNTALEKVAFLPFGLLVDKWRWQVFSGKLTPENYNEGWWRLRENYQGIKAPVGRDENHFDPGAKFHIPNNTPYLRYFLARMLQYQFHHAACEKAGWEGPVHRCSIYSNEDVGREFENMMALGASMPWPDALETFTGKRKIDGAALLAYFEPLRVWLDKQNAGRQCGWNKPATD